MSYDAGLDGSTTLNGSGATLQDAPTMSHSVAVADHDDKGMAQLDHGEPEVMDLGWHEALDNVPTPLVAGLSNEQLFMLIRRFNKVRRPRREANSGRIRPNRPGIASSKCTMSKPLIIRRREAWI